MSLTTEDILFIDNIKNELEREEKIKEDWMKKLEKLVPLTDDPVLLDFFSTFKNNMEISRNNKRSHWIQIEVAKNKSTSQKTLTKLLKIKDIQINEAIASNTSASQEILRELSINENKYIRKNVAANPSTTQEILLDLNDGLNNALEDDLELLEYEYFDIIAAKLSNPNSSIAFLEEHTLQICNSPVFLYKKTLGIINNPNATSVILNDLLEHIEFRMDLVTKIKEHKNADTFILKRCTQKEESITKLKENLRKELRQEMRDEIMKEVKEELMKKLIAF